MEPLGRCGGGIILTGSEDEARGRKGGREGGREG